MLKINIPEIEAWDSKSEQFITIPAQTLLAEHSLLSISKWEAKYNKSFLSTKLSNQEFIEYFKCMLITQNVNTSYFELLPYSIVKEIIDYIEAPMTATTFSNHGPSGGPKDRTVITSELIYYWMILHEIPFECEKWHLNRLLTLIRVCNAKNGNTKKMSKGEIFENNRALNAARRAKLKSRG